MICINKEDKMFKLTFTSLVLITLLFFGACKRDKTAPVISLIGENPFEITYTNITSDPGATAHDETDGNITNEISSDWKTVINVNKRAEYLVTYTSSDKAANTSTATRKVIVRYSAANLIGNYNSTWTLSGTLYTGNASYTITAGDTPNQVIIQNYGPQPLPLKLNLSGTYGELIDFNQTYNDHVTEGTGTIENDGTVIKLNFRRTYTNGAVIHGTETLVKI